MSLASMFGVVLVPPHKVVVASHLTSEELRNSLIPESHLRRVIVYLSGQGGSVYRAHHVLFDPAIYLFESEVRLPPDARRPDFERVKEILVQIVQPARIHGTQEMKDNHLLVSSMDTYHLSRRTIADLIDQYTRSFPHVSVHAQFTNVPTDVYSNSGIPTFKLRALNYAQLAPH